MLGHDKMHAQLLSLMEEVLSVCITLQNFSDEKLEVFSGDNDQKIIEAIKERESIINVLIHLEYKIDLILDEVDEYAYGGDLPPSIDEVRQTVRRVLSSIMEMDAQALKLVSGKMQKYKDKTLKARNKKHLSAYIKTSLGAKTCSSYDYKN